MQQNLKKKIIIILPHSGAGGDSQVILNLLYANSASNEIFDFHLLINSAGELHDEFKRFAKVYTFPIDDYPLVRKILRRLSVLSFEWLKKKYYLSLINKLKPDLVYINTVNENELSQAVLSSGKKFAVHPHELDFVVTHRISDVWIENLVNYSAKIISPAHAAAIFYQDVYCAEKDKTVILHETVSDKRIHWNLNNNTKSTLRPSNDVLLIGGSGSIIFRKGVDTFIRACSIVRQQYTGKIKFFWLGGQSNVYKKQIYFKSLVNLLKTENLLADFEFLPYTAQVGSFFNELDLMVLPSRIEAFPLVVLEAMLFEKPVVAMDVGGVREVVDEQTGYLVKDRTPEGLAKGIIHFLESEKLRKETGKRGRERVLKNFEAEVQVKKWLQILHELTD
ncbi:D-inositol-3-phosphate glycosyltransferase [Dyadobacter sp. CECT 9275]|uniref:D-inositol-3-phosphate glycosyltransferase n=1 Tax=Dyadobacter helix TaxID=2822344 RepID=A0A916NMQ1_9BACT|nr:glycosyltransferase family 4 protein [Dyadobacter sp. CECT 9275]CAG5007993.1 D-inositol-3-phosphate glycosyltransferase [Dyadobacter sp. CECT 9275]